MQSCHHKLLDRTLIWNDHHLRHALREYGLEDAVKKLVRKHCCDQAPVELRAKILIRIQEVRAQIEVID